jgi:hypothetical protein
MTGADEQAAKTSASKAGKKKGRNDVIAFEKDRCFYIRYSVCKGDAFRGTRYCEEHL